MDVGQRSVSTLRHHKIDALNILAGTSDLLVVARIAENQTP